MISYWRLDVKWLMYLSFTYHNFSSVVYFYTIFLVTYLGFDDIDLIDIVLVRLKPCYYLVR